METARVPLADRGHTLGDGVFETMRVLDGRVFQRELHGARLDRGLATLGLGASTRRHAWEAADDLAASASKRIGPDLRLRLQVTTGESDHLAGEPGRSNVTAIARPFQAYPTSAYEKGVRLVLAPIQRPLGPSVKTTSFHAHATARRLARDLGADDTLLLNSAGRICEATTSNVLAVIGDRIHAPGPSEGALDGTTRDLARRILKTARVSTVERLTRPDLMRASEVLLTNVNGGIVPVHRVDDRRLQGPSGKHYRALRSAYLGVIEDFRNNRPRTTQKG